MFNVDLKTLYSKLNGFCSTTMHNAIGLCVSRAHYEVMAEHFLLKCLETPQSDIPLILRRFEIDPGRVVQALTDALNDAKTGNAGKPVFSPFIVDLFEASWMYSSIDLQESRIRSGAVLLTFLGKPTAYTGVGGGYVDILKSVSRETLLREFWVITKGSSEERAPAGAGDGAPGEPGKAGGDSSFIGRFCQDFTARAREGKVDPAFGRDNEIRQIVDVLARRRKNNPILVGEPGVGKTAVMEGLAMRIIEDDVPELLHGVTLLGLDMGALEAGAGMKGEFENRLRGVITEIKSSEKPIILFIDEAHTLVGAGGASGGGDAANLLKPALARGELKVCGATTWSEYKKYFEKDPALARRFQLIKLDEPSVETATIILQGLKENLEKAHNVVIRNDAIEAAADYSARFIQGRFLPDKAIDLLDTSCARVKVNLSAKPGLLEDTERAIQANQRTKKTLERDRENNVPIDEEKYQDIVAKIESLTKEAADIKERWLKEQEAAKAILGIRDQIHALPPEDEKRAELKTQLTEASQTLAEIQGDNPIVFIEVNPDVVGQVIAGWTGIPMGKVKRDESQIVLHLEEQLKTRIKGQDYALEEIAKVVKAAKSGIKNPGQPIGVFLLAGPSGVGKTETGLALADLLFGGESNTVTINMSEFKESHTVSRLIGSPPGYVGYGEGGMLTEAVRRRPYSVVLLDEVEKAHLSVMELFYQVFDKGILTDGEGKEISFKNTVIILTSNLASDVIQEMTGGDEPSPMDAVVSAIRPMLSQHFKPALLARMNVIPYLSLKGEAMMGIVDLKLHKLKTMLMDNNKMRFDWTPAVAEQIKNRCTEIETGARNIEYIINGNILPQLSQTILEHMTEGEMPSKVHLDLNEDGSFKMDFSGE
jgi:type VI secretion system protein VasG